MVIGISPGLSSDEYVQKYHFPTEGFDVLIYTGSGLMGRAVENIHSSDIVVIAGGRSGMLGEFALAYDEGRLIDVLTNTCGIANAVAELVLLFSNKPIKVLRRFSGVILEDSSSIVLPDALAEI
jgi:predicted Rossmann-fold nucleotide-binding protein